MHEGWGYNGNQYSLHLICKSSLDTQTRNVWASSQLLLISVGITHPPAMPFQWETAWDNCVRYECFVSFPNGWLLKEWSQSIALSSCNSVFLSYFFSFFTFLLLCQYFPLIFLIKLAVVQEKNIPVHMSPCSLRANVVKIYQILLCFFRRL